MLLPLYSDFLNHPLYEKQATPQPLSQVYALFVRAPWWGQNLDKRYRPALERRDLPELPNFIPHRSATLDLMVQVFWSDGLS